MRVLLVVSGSARSGGEAHARTLARLLSARGHAVALLCPPGSWVGDGLEGVEVRRADFRRVLGAGAHRAMARALREHRPDVVHAHLSRAGYVSLPACRFAKVPLVLSVHTETREPLYRLAATGRNRLIAVSGFIRDVLASQGVPGGRVDVVYHGVEQGPAPTMALESAGLAPGERAFGLVGRLAPEKGQHIAVQAMGLVGKEFPEAVLVCVGRDVSGFRSLLEAEARRLAANVRFVEHFDDVPGFFGLCEAALLPSVVESFGLVVAEAMSAGLPVMVSPAGALPELVEDRVTGRVLPQDPGLWAEELAAWLREPARARAMGEAGRERAQRMFSLEAMLDGVELAYHRAMEQR